MIEILMPIYNGIEFITDSIPSILCQSYKEWELIIGINGYDKNSDVYNIAKKYEKEDSRIKVLDLYKIKGKANALNEMLNYSKYEWISLLDVDDKWLPRKLEEQVPFMKEYDVIGTKCKYFGDSNITPPIVFGDISKYNFLIQNPIINSSCLIKKELCQWDEKEEGIEDYNLWLKLWKSGKKFYNVETIQVLHRIHKDSAFNSKNNNAKVSELRKKYI